MKIVHVLSSLQVGGAEWAALRLTAEQRKMGHDARLLALSGGPLIAQCQELGVPVHALEGRGMQLASRVFSYFARERADVVNGHNPPAYRHARLSRLSGRPVLTMTLHGEASRSYRRLLTWPPVDTLIAVSARARDTFLMHDPTFPHEKLVVIENGVPLPAARSAAERLSSPPGELVVLSVARLDPIKDFGTLLQAWAILKESLTGPRLLVAGDGVERPRLEALARELGLSDHVTFLGYRPDVATLLANADLFVLSSHSEGMPLSVLEAMAAGLPVVATAVGGTPEVIVEGETGLLVPHEDAHALAAALHRLCANPRARWEMGQSGRARVQERFGLERMARRYLEVYQLASPGRQLSHGG